VSAVWFCLAGRPDHRPSCAHHFACDRAHRVVETAEPVIAGDCRPTWVAGLIPTRRRSGATPLHFCLLVHASSLLFSLLRPPLGLPSPATANVEQEHRRVVLVIHHPVRARAAGCSTRRMGFLSHRFFTSELVVDRRAPSSSGPTKRTASFPVVPCCSPTQGSTLAVIRPLCRRPSSSPSLGRHDEPLSAKLIPIKSLGHELGPQLVMHWSPAAVRLNFTVKHQQGRGKKLLCFLCSWAEKPKWVGPFHYQLCQFSV
jgi:hypothetical protein